MRPLGRRRPVSAPIEVLTGHARTHKTGAGPLLETRCYRTRMVDGADGLKRSRPTGISVVLPAYDEDANVGRMIDRALVVLSLQNELKHEIIVVDDGSGDRTAEIVGTFVDRYYPRVRLVRHLANQGYGAALRTGFGHACHDLIFYTDADNQFDIGELAGFLSLIEHYDVVAGFRVRRYDPVHRVIASWVYNRLVRAAFRVAVRDVDCAFKLFRREVLDEIDIECTDFFIDTELLVRARKAQFRIIEKGVQHFPRLAGQTTVFPSDVPRTLRTLITMFYRTHRPSSKGAAAKPRHANGAFEVPPGPVAQ